MGKGGEGGERGERETETERPASSEKVQKERAGVGGACLLKEPLHLCRPRVLLAMWDDELCQVPKGWGHGCLEDNIVEPWLGMVGVKKPSQTHRHNSWGF